MTNILPRILLAIMGILSIGLSMNNLYTVWLDGPSVDTVFMSIFAALMACVCIWAAAGAGRIFSEDK